MFRFKYIILCKRKTYIFPDFIYARCYLFYKKKEILHPLVKLSLCLQRSDVTLADIQIMTETTVTMLNSLKDQ